MLRRRSQDICGHRCVLRSCKCMQMHANACKCLQNSREELEKSSKTIEKQFEIVRNRSKSTCFLCDRSEKRLPLTMRSSRRTAPIFSALHRSGARSPTQSKRPWPSRPYCPRRRQAVAKSLRLEKSEIFSNKSYLRVF